MLRDVVQAELRGAHRVHLRFDDGVAGEVDLADAIDFEGVFEPLSDPARFAELRLNPELGTICWPNGADLAPEFLYELVKAQAA